MRYGVTTNIFPTPTGDREDPGSREIRTGRPRSDAKLQFNKVTVMNWDTVKGNWKQFRGKVKEQWGDLTDDDLDRIEGKRDQLLGAVQKRYGIARDEAERQLKEFETTVD